MGLYRVYAEMITDVYVDVEANSEDEARNIAAEIDGGEFFDAGTGDWKIGSAIELD